MVDMAKAKESRRTAANRGYSVRPATRDDLKPIVGLYNWAVNQTFATIDSEPLDAEEARGWGEMHGRRSVLLVASDGGGGSGWARLVGGEEGGLEVVRWLVYALPWTS